MTRGALFSQMTPPEELEDEFNDWYDTEHVPARLALPAFDHAARYRAASGRDYVAVYDVSDVAVFDSPEYELLRTNRSDRTRRIQDKVDGFTRFTCIEQSDVGTSGPQDLLYVVAFDVPDDRVEAYDAWYELEHTDMLMAAEKWRRVRRLIVVDGAGGPWTHLTLHYIADETALDSPERAAARVAPMRNALVSEPWFSRSERWVYHPIEKAPGESARAGSVLDNRRADDEGH